MGCNGRHTRPFDVLHRSTSTENCSLWNTCRCSLLPSQPKKDVQSFCGNQSNSHPPMKIIYPPLLLSRLEYTLMPKHLYAPIHSLEWSIVSHGHRMKLKRNSYFHPNHLFANTLA